MSPHENIWIGNARAKALDHSTREQILILIAVGDLPLSIALHGVHRLKS
jgi:hypothetical protein